MINKHLRWIFVRSLMFAQSERNGKKKQRKWAEREINKLKISKWKKYFWVVSEFKWEEKYHSMKIITNSNRVLAFEGTYTQTHTPQNIRCNAKKREKKIVENEILINRSVFFFQQEQNRKPIMLNYLCAFSFDHIKIMLLNWREKKTQKPNRKEKKREQKSYRRL